MCTGWCESHHIWKQHSYHSLFLLRILWFSTSKAEDWLYTCAVSCDLHCALSWWKNGKLCRSDVTALTFPLSVCFAELRDFEPDDQQEIEVDEGNTAVIECHLPESQPKAQVRYSVKQEWLETSKGTELHHFTRVSHNLSLLPSWFPCHLHNLPEYYNPAIQPIVKPAIRVLSLMLKHGNAVVYFSNYLLPSCLEEKKSSSGLWLVCWWCLGAVGTDICSLSEEMNTTLTSVHPLSVRLWRATLWSLLALYTCTGRAHSAQLTLWVTQYGYFCGRFLWLVSHIESFSLPCTFAYLHSSR